MLNIGIFILGFVLATLGLFFIFLHLNLFVMGYSFLEFVYFIIRSIWCDFFFIGIFLLFLSLRRKR